MSDLLWQLENVWLGHKTRARLCDVSLEIRTGVTAVMGCSGAGKTSLLNLLVGFENPDRGNVKRVVQESERLAVYWVPPQDGLWPHLTVRAHLEEVLPDRKREIAQVGELLRGLEIEHLSDKLPGSLSQGERSRLAVARGLASQAHVLVMDEPLRGIDDSASRRYWRFLQETCTKRDVSLVFASHDPEIVLREAEQVICLSRGGVFYAGSVWDLYESPRSFELAQTLGPVNSIPGKESIVWLGESVTEDLLIRPERLRIEPMESSPLEVEDTRFSGALEEVRIHSKSTLAIRTFYHRPAKSILAPGMGVAIRLLLIWWMCLMASGCRSGTEPVLSAKQNRTWNLTPVKGFLPAPRGVHAASTDELYILDNAGRVLVYDQQRKLTRHWFMPEYDIGKPERLLRLKDGRVAVADTHYGRVIFFSGEGKVLSTIGKIGRNDGEFLYPVALAEDASGNLFVCEYGGNDRIQKFDITGKFLMKFGKSGVGPGEFQRPSGVVWKDSQLYVADAFNNRIQIFRDNGTYAGVLGNGAAVEFYYPYDIAIGPDQDFYVVEYGAGRVTRLSASGELKGRYGKAGQGVEEFSTPWGLSVDQRGRIYVTDTGNRRMVEIEQ